MDAQLAYDFLSPQKIVFGWGRRREVGVLGRSLGRRAFLERFWSMALEPAPGIRIQPETAGSCEFDDPDNLTDLWDLGAQEPV